MRLALSQSLFSSRAVDAGTHLLLKTIAAARDRLPKRPAALDLGCGCGVLGLALALDGADVLFRDRDALALAVSAYNCIANGLAAPEVEGQLDMTGLGRRMFHLIVSNLPAKAGPAVHGVMAEGIRRHLQEGGLAAVVVVGPLEERIGACLGSAGLAARVAERTAAHVVFHATAAPGSAPVDPPSNPLAAYYRATRRHRVCGTEYDCRGVWGLPEFDTLAFATRLAMESMSELPRVPPTAPTLIWNPGQGHVPAWLAARGAREISLAGRDLLALRAGEQNAAGSVRRLVHAWHPDEAGTGYRRVVLVPDDDPAAHWEDTLPVVLGRTLAPGGELVLGASSTFVSRFLRACEGWRRISSRKTAGARCVVLGRPD